MTDPNTPSTTGSIIDSAFDVLDHLAVRMTASAATGLGCGVIHSIYKGLPIAKTSMSAAISCALVSTACFGAERLSYGLVYNVTGEQSSATPNILYGSHALGGLCGGGLVGFLYQGNPIPGMILLTPIMLGIGKLEISLNAYKSSRMQQLNEINEATNDQR